MKDKKISPVENLVKSIKYQAGSVVSRTIINKKTGTVTLFAFDKGQSLSEHAAPYDVLLYVADGASLITISGRPYTVEKGETIVLPARKPHSVKAIDKFKMLLVMIKS